MYHWAQNVDATSGALTTPRLSNIGLSGGFGTILLGRQTTASRTHVGFLDNASFLGDSETPGRSSNTISYALSVGSVSFKIDGVGMRGSGWSATAPAATVSTNNYMLKPAGGKADGKLRPAAAATATSEDKGIDSAQLGMTLALGENGKIALAYADKDGFKDVKDTSTHIAGHYSIGGMGFHLGYAVHDYKFSGIPTLAAATPDYAKNREDKTIFYGVAGALGDTGVNFFMQVRNKKSSGKIVGDFDNNPSNPKTIGDIEKNSHTPYAVGISRALGGGASVHLEHSDPDLDDTKSTSVLALKVDF